MRLWLVLLPVLSSVRGWCIACLLAAGVLALHSRHEMNPDGLSYLDMATEALRHGPAELVHPYWGPAYPAMIAIALKVANPSAAQEVPLLHEVNFLIFVVTLVAFCYFLRSWLAALKEYAPLTPSDRRLLTGFVFALFFYFIVKDIGLHLVTPDLALAAVLFVAAGLGCRLCVPEARASHHVALGVALGAGYYLKSAMFPLAPAFLALVYLAGPRATRMRRYGVVLSGVAFLVTVSPLVTALSLRMNKFTYGEVGRLNYAWFVNGLVWTARNEVPQGLSTREFPAHIPAECEERVISPDNEAAICCGDITDGATRRSLIELALERFGRVDVLVNNAGVGLYAPPSTVDVDLARRMFEVNVFAPLALSQLAIAVMRKQGGGAIVNVGSVGGYVSLPWAVMYCSSKFALHAVSDSQRRELAREGIRVTKVCPGIVDTDFREHVLGGAAPPKVADIKRVVSPEQVAATIMKGRQDGRAHVVRATDRPAVHGVGCNLQPGDGLVLVAEGRNEAVVAVLYSQPSGGLPGDHACQRTSWALV